MKKYFLALKCSLAVKSIPVSKTASLLSLSSHAPGFINLEMC